ncbi:MAG: hypothetical protein AAFR66_15880, partial [Bacteroidota bacterium]
PFQKFLSDRMSKEHFLSYTYPDLFQDDRNGFPLFKLTQTPLKAIINSKNLYYFLFTHLKMFTAIYRILERINGGYDRDNNPLANLRNHSMLGHGYKGVSKHDLEQVLGPFEHFLQQLQKSVKLDVGLALTNLFDEQNVKINEVL